TSLPRPQDQRRQEPKRSPPLPETPPRQRRLPRPHRRPTRLRLDIAAPERPSADPARRRPADRTDRRVARHPPLPQRRLDDRTPDCESVAKRSRERNPVNQGAASRVDPRADEQNSSHTT